MFKTSKLKKKKINPIKFLDNEKQQNFPFQNAFYLFKSFTLRSPHMVVEICLMIALYMFNMDA